MKHNAKPMPSSEITPEERFLSRRQFIRAAGLLAAGAALTACTPGSRPDEQGRAETPTLAGQAETPAVSERGELLTPLDKITTYTNFYELNPGYAGEPPQEDGYKIRPWTVEITGLVKKPVVMGIDEILKRYPQEERVYRMRCVEGWSMVIPWLGFPLSRLLQDAEPQGAAKFVRFVALLDPEQMPGQILGDFPWPYAEGLRLDEAMHDLTILASGLYGEPLLPKNGAPLRLVVPWKYGFKSIKAIVRIELVEDQPATFWNTLAPQEYGFYANVNPLVAHPRWSQSSELRIGETNRRSTLVFNGYEEEVASMYAGMDLRRFY